MLGDTRPTGISTALLEPGRGGTVRRADRQLPNPHPRVGGVVGGPPGLDPAADRPPVDPREAPPSGLLALYHQLSAELAETNRGVVALHADLDERSAQLRVANEAKTRFLANIGHELRAPVTAILGLVRLLRDPGSDPLTADQREQLALLEGSASDLLGLVNELLDLAKAESGRLEPRWGTVDLPGLFGALRGTMRSISRSGAARPDATRTEVEIVVEEPDGLPPLRSDEAMLTQVLRNLMTNAIKFTLEGEVRLAAGPVGADRVAFTVSD